MRIVIILSTLLAISEMAFIKKLGFLKCRKTNLPDDRQLPTACFFISDKNEKERRNSEFQTQKSDEKQLETRETLNPSHDSSRLVLRQTLPKPGTPTAHFTIQLPDNKMAPAAFHFHINLVPSQSKMDDKITKSPPLQIGNNATDTLASGKNSSRTFINPNKQSDALATNSSLKPHDLLAKHGEKKANDTVIHKKPASEGGKATTVNHILKNKLTTTFHTTISPISKINHTKIFRSALKSFKFKKRQNATISTVQSTTSKPNTISQFQLTKESTMTTSAPLIVKQSKITDAKMCSEDYVKNQNGVYYSAIGYLKFVFNEPMNFSMACEYCQRRCMKLVTMTPSKMEEYKVIKSRMFHQLPNDAMLWVKKIPSVNTAACVDAQVPCQAMQINDAVKFTKLMCSTKNRFVCEYEQEIPKTITGKDCGNQTSPTRQPFVSGLHKVSFGFVMIVSDYVNYWKADELCRSKYCMTLYNTNSKDYNDIIPLMKDYGGHEFWKLSQHKCDKSEDCICPYIITAFKTIRESTTLCHTRRPYICEYRTV